MVTLNHDHIRRYYDEEYYADHRTQEGLDWHSRMIISRLGDVRGMNVLDVACGDGEWLEEMYRRGATVAGIDISTRALEQARARIPDVELHHGVAEDLPFEDDCFDIVTCLGSLEHFLDKQRALQEIRRVARRSARVLILVPNAGFLTRRIGLYRGTQQVAVKEDVKSLRDWESLLRKAGFNVAAKWRDLRMCSRRWIWRGPMVGRILRAAQASVLPFWPLNWQYQVYFLCVHDKVDLRDARLPT